MVQVIQGLAADHEHYGGGAPLVHVHYVERMVHGNGIAIRTYGEIKIAAKEVVFARELKLNTIQVLLLTPKTGSHWLYHVQKWVHNEGEYDNYASIDILSPSDAPYEMFASGGVAVDRQMPSQLPSEGSIWIDYEALGE